MMMDPSSPFSSASTLHLAMAAFFEASLMAISAFFIHKRSVDQVLHRLIEIRRSRPAVVADLLMAGDGEQEVEEEGFGGNEGFDVEEEEETEIGGGLGEDNLNFIRRYEISSSVPNVGFSNDWFEDHPSKSSTFIIRWGTVLVLCLPLLINLIWKCFRGLEVEEMLMGLVAHQSPLLLVQISQLKVEISWKIHYILMPKAKSFTVETRHLSKRTSIIVHILTVN